MSPASSVELSLDVHGVAVRVLGDAESVAKLAVHFEAFAAASHTDSSAPDVTVELDRGTPSLQALGRARADQVFERGVVYNRGARTWVDYHGGALGEYDFEREHGRVTAPDASDRVELGYLMIHSRLGALLERRGLSRLHALGVAAGERAAVVLTPSGGGKSTLARAVLRRTDLKLLGDDMVLVDAQGRAHPFHTPLGLSDPGQAEGLGTPVAFPRRLHGPKWIVPASALGDRLEHAPRPIAWVVALVRVSAAPSRIEPGSRAHAARVLARDMVVGIGLPQVIELVARRGARDLPAQLPSIARRAVAAAAVLRRARFATLEQSDPEEGAGLLVDLLREP